MCQRDPRLKVLVPSNKRPQAGLLYLPVIYIYIYMYVCMYVFKGWKKIALRSWSTITRGNGPIYQFQRLRKGPESLGSTPHWGPQRLFYKTDKMVGGQKKGKFLGIPVKPRLSDWVLIKTRVKGVKVDRIEFIKIGIYVHLRIYRMLRKRQFIIAYFLVFTRKSF